MWSPVDQSEGKLCQTMAAYGKQTQDYRIPFIILYYGLCSSTLIVINKVAVHNLQVTARAPVKGPVKAPVMAPIAFGC